MRRLREKKASYSDYAAGILTEVALVFAIFLAAFIIIWALGRLVA